MTSTAVSGILAQQAIQQSAIAQGAVRRQVQAENAIVGIIEKAVQTGGNGTRGGNLDILV